jgi:FdhD protein
VLETEITRVDVPSRKASKVNDCVAEEKPLYIFLNRNHYATIFCSPSNLKELTTGYLLAEGIVKSVDEIDEMNLNIDESICRVKLKSNNNTARRQRFSRHFSRVIRSACGSSLPYQFSGKLPKVKSRLTVEAETILRCVNRLNFSAETFRKTGGVHVAAIYNGEDVEALAEDIGRHNAVDKVIGIGALNRTDFSACFLALSGRLTGDIVFKAARVGVPIVASLAAAIDSGITMARNTGLTLVGFVRGNRMNIYTFPERVCL